MRATLQESNAFLNLCQTVCNALIDYIGEAWKSFLSSTSVKKHQANRLKVHHRIAHLYLRAHNLLLHIIDHGFLFEGHSTTPAVLTIRTSHSDLALLDSRLKRTASHVQHLSLAGGRDIEVKDVHRQTEGGAGVGDVDDACHVALNRGAGEEEVDLVVGIAKAAEVFNAACLSKLV